MNWYLFATVFFIVSLHQVFAAKKPTYITLVRAVIQPLLEVKPPKPFDFTKHEDGEWPRWSKRFDLRHI